MNCLLRIVVACCFFVVTDKFAPFVSRASEISERLKPELRILLKEIAYIGNDYREAVRSGEIYKDSEYREMQDFSESALKQFAFLRGDLSPDDQRVIGSRLAKLDELVKNKADYQEVLELTESLSEQVVTAFKVPLGPSVQPDFALGQKTYQNHCSSCHGLDGRGDGLAAASLTPPPRNFHAQEILANSSPFKFHNVLVTGIAGTSMQSFSGLLSPGEMWSVSFYLQAMPFIDDPEQDLVESPVNFWLASPESERLNLLAAGLDLDQLAGTSNEGLKSWLHQQGVLGSKSSLAAESWLQSLRLGAPFSADLALTQELGKIANGTKQAGQIQIKQAFKQAFSLATAGKELFAKGQFEESSQKFLESYLFAFQKTEAFLGVHDLGLVKKIEANYLNIRAFAKNAQTSEFEASAQSLDENLRKGLEICHAAWEDKGQGRVGEDFLAALVIILREGFEAFLIVGALLALLGNVGAMSAKKWVHLGWICALLMGGVSYYGFNYLLQISGAARETIEAGCTGISVLLLFYTGFWLLSQAEHRRWQKNVRSKTEAAIGSGRLWGLFSISFIAVYREAAETVMFYSALLRTSSSEITVLSGLATGALMLLVLCTAMSRYNVTLPIRKFFTMTSCLMVSISIVLAGKAVHELIEAGYFLSTPLGGFPSLEFLGIYPSLETLGTQALLLFSGLTIAFVITKNRERQLLASRS